MIEEAHWIFKENGIWESEIGIKLINSSDQLNFLSFNQETWQNLVLLSVLKWEHISYKVNFKGQKTQLTQRTFEYARISAK